ncbi:FAD-dependent oxidoreductase [Sphingomonas sp. H160509]|uniref:NAD(P)/FAD-dependent oxidoreductase n=1 Tax=Sphingomonas sp. H160509 TaxID=2955313 RepID=UPI0020982D53|nr:FAD-dependent oxidoreductase [Sphingomonas sp. H160509]MDD1449900.1 FAD-dependent oxidoreductase [Sphingomonas sp. H160509]
MKVAIVGAGIAGLSCALRLQQDGCDVTVLDKGRGAGGRMSTRRIAIPGGEGPRGEGPGGEGPGGEVAFDHGAQYLTMRDPAFVEAMHGWEAAGVVARWPAAGEHAWVGTDGMSAIVKHLAAQAEVHWNSRVTDIRHTAEGWRVEAPVTQSLTETFDAVVVATPAEQAAPLLAPHDPAMASEALACRSAPCWTAMLAFDRPLAIAHDVIRNAGIIDWAARNSAKPGRTGPEAWVVHATPAWSTAHLEEPADTVVDRLLVALAMQCGAAMPAPIVRAGHRWRYARATATDLGCLWNGSDRIGAAGDWLIAPRIESAWLSGRQLAEQMLAAV